MAAALLARLSLGALAASWVARKAEVIDDESWTSLTRACARRLGLPADVKLRRNERSGMPMAWGLFHPVVLLPAESRSWNLERRRVVLLHELAHLKRRDCQTQLLAQLACALHWFNPLIWLAARRLRAERERACDDLVLASGTKGIDYAQHLLEIARSVRPLDRSAWAAVSMAKPSQMEGRLMAILDSDRNRRSVTRVASFSVAILIASLVVPLAALQPWAIAEETERAALSEPEEPERGQEAEREQATERARETSQEQVQNEAIATGREQHIQALSQIAEGYRAEVSSMANALGIDLSSEELEELGRRAANGMLRRYARDSSHLEALGEAASAQLSERIFEAMIAALNDEDPEIREQAASSLGQLEDSRAVQPLSAVLRDDPDAEVREQAAWALGMIEDPAGVAVLSDAIGDADAAVREQAAWALGMIEDPAGVAALNDAIGDADAEVREQAAWALGMIEDPAGIAALSRAVSDPEPDVREQAVWALGMIEDESAVPGLSVALDDADPDVRSQAAWALGMIEDESAVPALIGALNDVDPDVREHAAWALGMIEEASAVDALSAALANDVEPAVRKEAAWALGMIEDESALEPLIDALENDVDKEVRETVLWAISMIAG